MRATLFTDGKRGVMRDTGYERTHGLKGNMAWVFAEHVVYTQK